MVSPAVIVEGWEKLTWSDSPLTFPLERLQRKKVNKQGA